MGIGNIITTCIAIVSLLFVIINYGTGRHDKNSVELDEMKTSLLKCNMKLDQICATTNETRSDIKSMNNRINDMQTEIELIKRDLKTAYIRIDELKRGDHLPQHLKGDL